MGKHNVLCPLPQSGRNVWLLDEEKDLEHGLKAAWQRDAKIEVKKDAQK